MVTLTLSVSEAAALLSLVGTNYTLHADADEHDRAVHGLVMRLNAELGDAVLANGGEEAMHLRLIRMADVVYTLAAAESERNRHTASDKLYGLGASMLDVDYSKVAGVREAYAKLGAQTKAKLSPELSTFLSSL
jgi:hypothetical protein